MWGKIFMHLSGNTMSAERPQLIHKVTFNFFIVSLFRQAKK